MKKDYKNERQLGKVVSAESNANEPNISRRLDPSLDEVYRQTRDLPTTTPKKSDDDHS